MSKYLIRINCIAFQDISVEADSDEEAEELALIKFNCPGSEGETCEILEKE